MKIIIAFLSIIIVQQIFAFSFNFRLFPINGIKNFGSYRAFMDGSIAKSCLDYKNPQPPKRYVGAVGDGIYRVKPDATTAQVDVFCDMSTDNGGWTLVMFDQGNTGTNTAPVVRAQSNASYFDTTMFQKPSSGAKFSSTDMIKYAVNKEFLIVNNINDSYIIKYSNDIMTNGIDFRGMTNWVYQSKQSDGTFVTCNGHVNNRGLSTYSDNIGTVCPNYSGTAFYYNSWHIRCETAQGASDSGYCNSGIPNRPVSIFIR